MKPLALILLLYGSPFSRAALPDPPQVFSPVVTASIHDEPTDGVGDALNTWPFEGLVRSEPGREDRAIHEYDVSSITALPVVWATLSGRVTVNTSSNTGVRSFDFMVYDADGQASVLDYSVSASMVGSASYHPPADSFFDYQIDATAAVKALVEGGATHIGLRVQASSSPNASNLLDALSATLEVQITGMQPYTTYCWGDGSSAACPCANTGGVGRGCANSTAAQGASLGAVGSFSVATGDSSLVSTGLVPNQPGLYFQGDSDLNSGLGVLFGDGLRCAGVNVVRLQVVFSDASGASSTTVDIASLGGVGVGDTKRYQLWYRDPAGSPCGAGFNLSNGLLATWGS